MSGRTVTYGPGWAVRLVPLVGIGLVVALFPYLGDRTDIRVVLAYAGLVVLVLVVPATWTSYRLDDEGIAVGSLGRRRRWAWGEVGGIRGRNYEPRIWPAILTTPGERFEILDRAGRRIHRISPWTARRQALVREIRERTRTREQGVPR